MTETITVTRKGQYSYDEVPYESNPYAQSHPASLRTVANLFGMEAPKLETARVLELGCAAGNNVLPIAQLYPKSKVIGIDLSNVQINEAKTNAKALGLKNIEFKACSVMDIDASFGEFDYIICHGVFSWVPSEVQDKILDIVDTNLSTNGVAYISYNTLPGWNMVRSIRDMMIYHTQSFSDGSQKVQQARALLKFMQEATEGVDTPHAKMLENEVKILSNQPDHYLRHEHLAENNDPIYFHDFADRAAQRGLQYLGDANIATMYLGNLSPKAQEKLQEIQNIIRTEQYMDFINNRRFRCSLLCKNSNKLSRNLDAEDILKFNVKFSIIPEKEESEININEFEPVKFFLNANKDSNLTTSSPNMKALLYGFAENKAIYLKVDDLCKIAAKKLKEPDRKALKNELVNNALRFVLSGHMQISTEPSLAITSISEKPKVSEVTRYQAKSNTRLWVTNLHHERIGINLFDKYAMQYMDGKHTHEEIIDKVIEHHVNSGDLTLNKNEQKITDPKEVRTELSQVLKTTLERLSQGALLIK